MSSSSFSSARHSTSFIINSVEDHVTATGTYTVRDVSITSRRRSAVEQSLLSYPRIL